MMASMISNQDAPYAVGGAYYCPAPVPTISEATLLNRHLEWKWRLLSLSRAPFAQRRIPGRITFLCPKLLVYRNL